MRAMESMSINIYKRHAVFAAAMAVAWAVFAPLLVFEGRTLVSALAWAYVLSFIVVLAIFRKVRPLKPCVPTLKVGLPLLGLGVLAVLVWGGA